MKIAPLLGFPACKLTNTTVTENLLDKNTQLRTLLAIEERFSPDIIFYFMDLSVEAQALGLKVQFRDTSSPDVIEHPAKDEGSFKVLECKNLSDVFSTSRMKLFADLTQAYKRVGTKKLACYVIGPLTLSAHLMDTNLAIISAIDNPDFLTKVIDFSTAFISKYTHELQSAGADYIVILEPTAVMLSPNQFQNFSAQFVEKIAQKINIPTILHICGNTSHLFDKFAKLKNVYGLSLDSMVDLKQAYKTTKKLVMGNIDPTMVASEPKETVKSKVRRLIDYMQGIDNFILSTGCDLPYETPLENIDVFFEISSHIKYTSTNKYHLIGE